MFESVTSAPADPMYELKKLADNCNDSAKVDLGVGIYRNERGGYHELDSIKKAKTILHNLNLGHDYELTTGNPAFLQSATDLIFGENSEVVRESRVASVQTISGTGACHLGALFFKRCAASVPRRVYIGTPAWGNYEPLFRLVGLTEIEKYTYWSAATRGADFVSVLRAVRNAPRQSIFILQGCCHNPSGADLEPSQWEILAEEMQKKDHFPFFDIAYQGLGSSMDEDAYAIRLFAQFGFEMVVCQSFSKNFGMYGERCGVLHIVTRSERNASCVQDQLRSLIRWEFSSSPAYGSRLVKIILLDPSLRQNWLAELSSMRERLDTMKSKLYTSLVDVHKVPGNWDGITNSKGLFCFLPLSETQCQQLIDDYRIFLPVSGRINVSGLSHSNIDRVAKAISEVVMQSQKHDLQRSQSRL